MFLYQSVEYQASAVSFRPLAYSKAPALNLDFRSHPIPSAILIMIVLILVFG